jgi:hypothetical protein
MSAEKPTPAGETAAVLEPKAEWTSQIEPTALLAAARQLAGSALKKAERKQAALKRAEPNLAVPMPVLPASLRWAERACRIGCKMPRSAALHNLYRILA